MLRTPRQASRSGVYHFMARGVNKKAIFHGEADYRFYLDLLLSSCRALNCQVYHYCLMTNHVHLILKTEDLPVLSRLAYCVQRRYAYYYCKMYQWSEQVFRRNFKSIPIESDEYLLECGRYIERNPVDAEIVSDPKDYPYSSYLFYAEGNNNTLITESPAYTALSSSLENRQAMYRFYVTTERLLVGSNKALTAPF